MNVRAKKSYTQKTLMDLAIFYCSKRETSRPKLNLYLKRKVDLAAQPEALGWIEVILSEFERLKVIDHERFAGILVREYSRRGKGKRYIEQKLKEKGVREQVATIEFKTDDELERAKELVTKSLSKTTFKKIADPRILKQKILQKVVAAGFDFGIAKKALDQVLSRS